MNITVYNYQKLLKSVFAQAMTDYVFACKRIPRIVNQVEKASWDVERVPIMRKPGDCPHTIRFYKTKVREMMTEWDADLTYKCRNRLDTLAEMNTTESWREAYEFLISFLNFEMKYRLACKNARLRQAQTTIEEIEEFVSEERFEMWYDLDSAYILKLLKKRKMEILGDESTIDG